MKAILVIDMPKSCADCHIMADKWCYGTTVEEVQDKININKRPKWCPLKPMPEYRDEHYRSFSIELSNIINSENRGYNKCINEILGEKDDR